MANIAPPPQGNPPAQPQGGQQANQPAEPPLVPFAQDWAQTPLWAKITMGAAIAAALGVLWYNLPSKSYTPKKPTPKFTIVDEEGSETPYFTSEPTESSSLKDFMHREKGYRIPTGSQSQFARAVQMELKHRRRLPQYRFTRNDLLMEDIVDDFDASDGYDGTISDATIRKYFSEDDYLAKVRTR